MSSDLNVVLIVMDTARMSDTSTNTPETDSTLTLSELASSGTKYSNCFASSPWTLPSHASLFTGIYSSKHGAHAGHKTLSHSMTVLAESFQSAGYETVAVSNNTWISDEFGFERGFETFYKTWQYVQSETDLGEVARTNEGAEMLRTLASRLANGNPLVNVANAIYGKFLRKQDDDGAKRTNEWVSNWLGSRDTDRPFFLFVNYLEPHLDPDDAVHAVNSQHGGDETSAADVRDGEDALNAVRARLSAVANVETEQLVRGNDPAEDVLEYVEEVDADELVIGVRKRNPTAKVVFGSVARSILLNADVPMRVVPREGT